MNRQCDWDVWNQRLAVIWADSVHGAQVIGEEGKSPRLKVDGVTLELGPSNWGDSNPEEDALKVEKAFETVLQGHAPEYWRNSEDPVVQALGWLDRRIGKRSWRQHDDQHGPLGRSPLEQQVRAMRDYADTKIEISATPNKAKRGP